MSAAPVYTAEDRSILLPYYKRFLVEPSLRLIPASVHPNSITHAGHLCNLVAVGLLVALRPQRGWLLIASMLLLHVYLWADNADGAHARRTKQSSAFGEFLDHGLDILNTVYIAVMTAWALGATHFWTIALIALIPAAAAVTCWEQTQTGVYRLGLLNQIESVFVLSGAMIGSAIWGTDVWKGLSFHGVTAYHFLVVWPATTIVFGFGRAIWRVARAHASIAPIFVFLLLHALILLAGTRGWVSTFVGVSFVSAVNIGFGVRQLVLRLHNEAPKVEPMLVLGVLGMVAFMAWNAAGLPIGATYSVALPAVACAIVALFSLRETRRGIHVLDEVEADGQ